MREKLKKMGGNVSPYELWCVQNLTIYERKAQIENGYLVLILRSTQLDIKHLP